MEMRAKTFTKPRLIETTYSDGYFSSSSVFQTYWSEDLFPVLQGSGDRISPTAFEFKHQVQSWYDGTVTYSAKSGEPRYSVQTGPLGTSCDHPPMPGDFSSELYNEALGKVFDQLRNKVDLAVDIAQAGQVSRMFRDAASTVQYVRSIAKGDWQKAYRDFSRGGNAKRIGSKWLEYQYGWKPLAQDLYGAVIELDKVLPSLLRIEGRAKSLTRLVSLEPWSGDPTILAQNQFWLHERIVFRMEFDPPASTSQLLGNFTSLNPASIAWELTPYSFVVDWFLDIGGYLRNLETAITYGCLFRSGYFTTGLLLQGDSKVVSVKDDGNSVTTTIARGDYKSTWGKRHVLGSMPWPRLPQFKCDLGSGRLLNAAALLSQHLR